MAQLEKFAGSPPPLRCEGENWFTLPEANMKNGWLGEDPFLLGAKKRPFFAVRFREGTSLVFSGSCVAPDSISSDPSNENHKMI